MFNLRACRPPSNNKFHFQLRHVSAMRLACLYASAALASTSTMHQAQRIVAVRMPDTN